MEVANVEFHRLGCQSVTSIETSKVFYISSCCNLSICHSLVISSGLVGLFIGLASKRFKVDKGLFATKDVVTFNIVQILANLLAWGVISPLGDILIYSEPANKVFIQGLIATLANAITIGIGGTLLILIYAKTRTQSNSLSKD